MAQIGRRVYYNKLTGEILTDTGEREGEVVETTIDDDFNFFPGLTGRTLNDTGVIELEYGELRERIEGRESWRVDIGSSQLVIVP